MRITADTSKAILTLAALAALITGATTAPHEAVAATPREEPRECKEFGPASPRCTQARNKQTRDRLPPRACEKYGAGSPQCERAQKKLAPKAPPKASAPSA